MQLLQTRLLKVLVGNEQKGVRMNLWHDVDLLGNHVVYCFQWDCSNDSGNGLI